MRANDAEAASSSTDALNELLLPLAVDADRLTENLLRNTSIVNTARHRQTDRQNESEKRCWLVERRME
jgi:hypothetical protein